MYKLTTNEINHSSTVFEVSLRTNRLTEHLFRKGLNNLTLALKTPLLFKELQSVPAFYKAIFLVIKILGFFTVSKKCPSCVSLPLKYDHFCIFVNVQLCRSNDIGARSTRSLFNKENHNFPWFFINTNTMHYSRLGSFLRQYFGRIGGLLGQKIIFVSMKNEIFEYGTLLSYRFMISKWSSSVMILSLSSALKSLRKALMWSLVIKHSEFYMLYYMLLYAIISEYHFRRWYRFFR